ncbi:MAG: ABC transporter permease [Lachnospiraceae bacterium]|nr:ABC transporter permease [Lachnospiraceae bacterium]
MSKENVSTRQKRKKESQLLSILKRLARNKLSVAGGIILLIIILGAVFAPLIAPYSYDAMDAQHILEKPSRLHICGTDNLGRDIFSRLLYGARYSLALGFVSVIVSQFFGVIIGSVVGYYGGVLEDAVMRVLDVIQSIPGTLLTITVATVFGSGFGNTILALAISHIPGSARNTRALVLSVRKNEYLEAADACNCSDIRKIVTHILPNIISYMIVSFITATAYTILQAASLSYIGLGVQPPTPEWGALLTSARDYMRDYTYMLIFPCIFIALTVLSLNLLGDGLRDAMDPKMKR